MLKWIQITYGTAGVRLLKGNGGLFDITGQATLGLYALFADFIVVRATVVRQRH